MRRFFRCRRAPTGARVLAALALAGTLACGYSFRSPVPAHLNTVYVPTFENETREFQLTQQITERVIGEFLNESRLRLVGNEADADLLVLGAVKLYEEEALSYDPGQAANPDVFSRRVLVTVDVRLEDQVREETLWENASLRQWGEFSEEQGETREDGITRALDKISEEILRHVVEEF
ncbi:MAG TPA: LptE family protein [Gemmatimonadota bacterium]|nr:LptE family protein [Gemmatimonadota bacterium]